jgi:hypothetical protein
MCRSDSRIMAAVHSVFSLLHCDACLAGGGPDQFQSSVPQWQAMAQSSQYFLAQLAKHLGPSSRGCALKQLWEGPPSGCPSLGSSRGDLSLHDVPPECSFASFQKASSRTRVTAAAFGFLTLIQALDGPDR